MRKEFINLENPNPSTDPEMGAESSFASKKSAASEINEDGKGSNKRGFKRAELVQQKQKGLGLRLGFGLGFWAFGVLVHGTVNELRF